MKLKKLMALLLSLTVALIPAMGLTAMAADGQVHYVEHTFDGPYYTGGIMPGVQDVSLQADDAVEAAAATLREAMRKRQTTVEVTVPGHGTSESQTMFNDLLNMAMAHTGVPDEGDYIRTIYAGADGKTSSTSSRLNITYNIKYRTTAEQEKEVDAAVDALLAQLNVDGMDDFHKVWTIYNWMCDNIVYDYEHLEDKSYQLMYSPYAALINRTAVCQGYAGLLYRLLLEVGVDCRYVSGLGNGGDHGWNIVELDGKYYNLDSTWDSSGWEYKYFLKSNENFTGHVRGSEYETAEFNAAYPMDTADYKVPAPEVPVTGVKLDKTKLTLSAGQTAELKATVLPQNASNQSIVWHINSDESSVAKVRNGVVTALSPGEVTVYAISRENSDNADVCHITVTEAAAPVESVTLDRTELSLTTGDTELLTATVLPDDAGNKNVVWTSDDEDVATVKNGLVTAMGPGETVVRAASEENAGIFAQCTVKVAAPAVHVYDITLDSNELTLTAGDTAELTATVLPENADNKNVVWSSDNEDVAVVDNGTVTAVSAGQANITAASQENPDISAVCAVTVEEPEYVPVEGISLESEKIVMKVGEKAAINATVLPENATNKKLYWASADEDVATVEDGVVTALSEGIAVIIVYPDDNGDIIEGCSVIVTNGEYVPAESISFGRDELVLNVGDQFTVDPIVMPEDATYGDVLFWGSYNSNVVTVEDGVVTALREGQAGIYVYCVEDPNVIAICNVIVKSGTDVPVPEEPKDYTVLSLKGDVPQSGTFYAEVEMVKNSDRAEKDTLIIAVYKDGALVDMTYMKAQFLQGQTVTFGGRLTAMEGCTLKAFVWDSLDGMQSLSNTLEK